MENTENTPSGSEKIKKSNLLNYLALAIVVFFAGYYILNASSTDDNNDNDDSKIEVVDGEELPDGKGGEGLLTAGRYGEAGELNAWKDSGDNFTLAVLSDWEIHQIDAGPVSIVEIYHPDSANESVTLWLQ